ncbi:MAG: zinc-binding dehydrogenase [Thermoleophilaceae bacterium]
MVEVLAAGLNPVDIALASGTFYGGAPPLPSVVGRGGHRPYRGRRPRVLRHAGGSLRLGGRAGEGATPPRSFPCPRTAVADELAVAFGIAGLAAWLSLEKAEVQEGETVLVLGASGVVGQIAVQAAKLLGAGRVVAAARDEAGLTRAGELGADAAVKLDSAHDLTEAFREATVGRRRRDHRPSVGRAGRCGHPGVRPRVPAWFRSASRPAPRPPSPRPR